MSLLTALNAKQVKTELGHATKVRLLAKVVQNAVRFSANMVSSHNCEAFFPVAAACTAVLQVRFGATALGDRRDFEVLITNHGQARSLHSSLVN